MSVRTLSVLTLSLAAAAPAWADEADLSVDAADPIVVTGSRETYTVAQTSSATRTPTDLNDVPQAVSVVTERQIEDQGLQSIADVLRYVPGAVTSQGEGHRDQIILRGNSSTADFFVDGLRDDVQYYRGLYNLERVEVLKGPNAMIFGRGGGGGVVNRVTKRPEAKDFARGAASLDSWGAWSADLDLNRQVAAGVAGRLNGTYEEFANHRDFYRGRRIGLNPTLALIPGERTRIDLGYEHDDDRRTVDRGVPSVGVGTLADPVRPLAGYRRTFFGMPGLNRTAFRADVLKGQVQHDFSDALSVTSRILYGDYDKFYQNAFAAEAVRTVAGVPKVGIEAYNDRVHRRNLISQTDLVWRVATGPVRHVLLAGFEGSDQKTRTEHLNGFFDGSAGTTNGGRRVSLPLARRILIPAITFRRGTGERLVRSDAEVFAFYVQDQVSIGEHLDLIAGLRRDRFRLDVTDLYAARSFSRTDALWSPRFGAVVKPTEATSLYASYGRSYLPQSGDQFSSLDVTLAALEPERFDNYEVGFKWNIRRALSLSAAAYRLDRTNTRATDPLTSLTVLTGAQRSKGFEIGLSGEIRSGWSVSAGYAYTDAEIRRTTAAAPAGRKVALVPHHQASLWTRYDLTARFAAGAGIYHQSRSFTSISNTVVLPAFTRVDAAAYYRVADGIEAQVNVENLLGSRYFSAAFNDNNIMPGAPPTVRGTLRFAF
ncbi:MAG: TonB-dependent siderophore receptor [Alphaproteobacteria bacterium]|nr:TonB-dependent siderophore receptor [Alphaproteobacteria bacterium]MBV9373143.1 TonB-dependent siderophore receptor [Alphaproteobacteria bacterium]MBV9900232.1 TonB-dependent siderophore receptor [Alphaproteobacteria bacterium]